jgi:hypothetical protein
LRIIACEFILIYFEWVVSCIPIAIEVWPVSDNSPESAAEQRGCPGWQASGQGADGFTLRAYGFVANFSFAIFNMLVY